MSSAAGLSAGDPVGPASVHLSAAAPTRRSARANLLLYLTGLTLPFPEVGIPLNEVFTLSFTTLAALAFSIQYLAWRGLTTEHRAAVLMLMVFAATAVTRHAFASYVLSLGALSLGLLVFASSRLSTAQLVNLVRGLIGGLVITLVLMALTIFPQVIGVPGLLGPARAWLIGTEQTGTFLGYIRPFAGFSEPSHLAIYLSAVYVVLDLLVRAGRQLMVLRAVTALAVVLSGSVSGLVLLFSYVVFRWLGAIRRLVSGRISGRFLIRSALASVVVLVLFLALGPDPGELATEYSLRLLKTIDDVQTGNLVGSEGSRVNAILALPDYWESAGLPGFLAGTGYANHQGWLIDTYGHLNESATFSRGAIDSVLIAVFLATGIFGFLAYLRVLWVGFGGRVLRLHIALIVFVLVLNFSYGYLIAGLYWQLLFVMAATARWCVLPLGRARARRNAIQVRRRRTAI